VSQIIDNDTLVEADGRTLLEEGRRARNQRAQDRTWKARFGRLFVDRPAWVRGVAIGVTLALRSPFSSSSSMSPHRGAVSIPASASVRSAWGR
jgi:hypothetical protein